jgi:hypothetical protein
MKVRFYLDPETEEPHIMVTESPKRKWQMSSVVQGKIVQGGTVLAWLSVKPVMGDTYG